jgi:uncharacterized membrane protein
MADASTPPSHALADWLALLAFFTCWAGYAWFSEHSRWASEGLIRRTRDFRLEWAYQMLAREIRVTDSTLIGNLVTSVTFYANTTIYIIAGLVAALGAADKLLNFTTDLAFAGAGQPGDAGDQADAGARPVSSMPTSSSPGRCGSSTCSRFWSARHRSVSGPEPASSDYAQRLAGANNLAGDDFNRGIRAYYFGLAASGWLLSPLLLAVLSVLILGVLYRRDYRSAALDILRH